MRSDFFHRLPRPTALLLLTSILDLAEAHVLHAFPRQTPAPTITIPHSALDVVSWPLLLPTPPPLDPDDLRRRQDSNTICGYLGGLSALPATCSAGSHCVLDSAHGVVGCCPDGQDTCTAGVFTACVDSNSGPQTVVNPYVFTCTGSNVCYKNMFGSGFSQYGCGTASDMATTVLATASGVTGILVRPTMSVPLTKGASTLDIPTTLGSAQSTRTASDTTLSSSSPSSSLTSSSASTSSTPSKTTVLTIKPPTAFTSETTAAPTSSSTPDPAAPPATAAPSRTGAIVGGTISGVAVLAALAALAFYLLRRHRGNTRIGPGNGRGSGINGKFISAPKPGPSSGFSAVNQDSEAYETGLAPPMAAAHTFSHDLSAGGPSPFAYTGASGAAHNSYPPADGGYHYPGQFPAAYAGAAAAAVVAHDRGGLDADQVPLTREIDDFSHGFQAALGRIGEEDEEYRHNGAGTGGGDLAVNESNGVNGGGDGPGYNGPMRPLWQQNRRQSRNLMWM
ncbi:hypothetical protein B0T22DRAFT_457854 [Podospora appendiculata]|uniref:Mid2 domain-containing protein n=1 Tax=Podospora appendiculata TaxID=314037 RepID=A0AAE1CBL9_9PEZI|nr:hypothetical protein B0T22DRAFT_457854 [Podospora appendiculata]